MIYSSIRPGKYSENRRKGSKIVKGVTVMIGNVQIKGKQVYVEVNNNGTLENPGWKRRWMIQIYQVFGKKLSLSEVRDYLISGAPPKGKKVVK
jgi:hypothetical protein